MRMAALGRQFRGRTVVSGESLRLAQKFRVRSQESFVHGQHQLQAEVRLTRHRLSQDMSQRFATSSSRMSEVGDTERITCFVFIPREKDEQTYICSIKCRRFEFASHAYLFCFV